MKVLAASLCLPLLMVITANVGRADFVDAMQLSGRIETINQLNAIQQERATMNRAFDAAAAANRGSAAGGAGGGIDDSKAALERDVDTFSASQWTYSEAVDAMIKQLGIAPDHRREAREKFAALQRDYIGEARRQGLPPANMLTARTLALQMAYEVSQNEYHRDGTYGRLLFVLSAHMYADGLRKRSRALTSDELRTSISYYANVRMLLHYAQHPEGTAQEVSSLRTKMKMGAAAFVKRETGVDASVVSFARQPCVLSTKCDEQLPIVRHDLIRANLPNSD